MCTFFFIKNYLHYIQKKLHRVYLWKTQTSEISLYKKLKFWNLYWPLNQSQKKICCWHYEVADSTLKRAVHIPWTQERCLFFSSLGKGQRTRHVQTGSGKCSYRIQTFYLFVRNLHCNCWKNRVARNCLLPVPPGATVPFIATVPLKPATFCRIFANYPSSTLSHCPCSPIIGCHNSKS